MNKLKLSLVIAVALLIGLPAYSVDTATKEQINYLTLEGHLPRAHWYSLKPGKPFWVYAVKGSDGAYISYTKIEGVPDLRPISERNDALRITTNLIKWAAPMAITALLGVGR